MEYKVVCVSAYDEYDAYKRLNDEVNRLLNNGWLPTGGASVATKVEMYSKKVVMVQALIKPDEKKLSEELHRDEMHNLNEIKIERIF